MWALASRLGYPSPRRLLHDMRPSELGMWWAEWLTDPWGEQRADLRAGIVASTIGNVNRDPKRASEYRPEHFMPYRPRDPQRENADLSRRLLAAFGIDPKAVRAKAARTPAKPKKG